MTNQEILKKAIQKAVDNGWDFSKVDYPYGIQERDWFKVIFNHDFAKALWGEVEMVEDYFSTGMVPKTPGKKNWVHHLQQMVVADDAIAYLSKNI